MTRTNRINLADELIGLGEHLKNFPDLTPIYGVLTSTLDEYLEVRLLSGRASDLRVWAETLKDVRSHAYRFTDVDVDGHVVGATSNGTVIEVLGTLDSDAFPSPNGRYDWDVFAEGGVSV